MQKCTFYYLTITEKDGKPVEKPERYVEPIGFWDSPRGGYYGKDPDYCCKTMRIAVENHNIQVNVGWSDTPSYATLYSTFGPNPNPTIKYCPFCAAEIEFVADVRIRQIKDTPRMVESWKHEEIK
jgi:hypothetical protein